MDSIETFLSADARNFRPSEIRKFSKLINDPRVISFAGGAPNPATFPSERISAIAADVISRDASVSLQYGPTLGLPRLREFCAEWTRGRQVRCDTSNVLLTTGSQQAVDLVAHALLDPGDVILVELPTYVGASSSFHGRRAELAGVRQNEDGVDLEDLERVARHLQSAGKRIKMFYTIPNFQNPSGRLMSSSIRRGVLELANRLDFLVLEDDPYGELTFDSDAPRRPIAADDANGRVIYLSSFSKVLAPGLRCGWIVAERGLIRTFELAKEAADLCSGMLDQRIVDEFCFAGELPPQIEKVRNFYQARRDVLIGAMKQELTLHATWTDARGGLFTFMTLRSKIDTRTLVTRAIELGVAFVPGSPFFVDGSGLNTMRLTFAKEPDERLRAGVNLLAQLLTEVQEPHK